MIRISPAFDFNAIVGKRGLDAGILDDSCAGGGVAAVNRPFTMPRKWVCDASSEGAPKVPGGSSRAPP
jgi:hypothetical protein